MNRNHAPPIPRKIRLAPACALLAMLASGPAQALDWPWQSGNDAADPPPRPVVSIITGDQHQPARSVPGVVAARYEVDLGFQTLGRLIERPVDIGDMVKTGQRLAALNPEDLEGNVDAAMAAVDAAEVQLRTARAAAERTRELARRNVASVAVLEQAETALTAAEAAYEQAGSELVRARDARSFATIDAPFDGVISDVYEDAGAIVAPGAPVMKISADSELEAVIDLPDAASAAARTGDTYEVWAEGQEKRAYPATIRVIEPVADPVTRTRRIRLTLKQSGDLRIGSLIRARPASKRAPSLTIPAQAVLMRDDAPHVWVVTRGGGGGAVSLRAVTIEEPALGGMVAVSAGLEAGEEIVTRGIHSLAEGQPVGRSVAP